MSPSKRKAAKAPHYHLHPNSFPSETRVVSGYEKCTAVFVFFNFVLSIGATVFAVKAVGEMRQKSREEYHRLNIALDDALP